MNKPSCQELEQRIRELEHESSERKRIEAELLEKQAILREQNISLVRRSIELSDIKRELEDQNYNLELSQAELEKALAALRQSEERYRQLVENANDIIYGTDASGHFSFVNPVAERMMGYSEQELIGRHYLDMIRPDYRQNAERFYGLQFVKQTPNTYYEFPAVTADGTKLWLGQNVRLAIEDGRVGGFQAVARDITERKRAEEALRESEEKVRDIFENVSDFLYSHDLEGWFTNTNSAFKREYGYTDDDLAHMNVRDLIPERFEHLFGDYLKGVLKEGKNKGLMRVMTKDGRERIIEYRNSVVYDATGPVAVRGSARDITERKRAEEEIRRLNEELEQRVIERTSELQVANEELEGFAYSVAHELRSPLRGMDGFSLALLEDYAERLDAGGQDYLHRVRAASQRMAQLIDDLLHLSRITRREMHRETVDLSALARKIAAELQMTQPDRDVEFVIEEGVSANGDARLLREVLKNLLGNGWKFTAGRPRARIEFGVARQDGETAYFVRDDGVGFDMAYANKLFGIFQRLHSMTTFDGNGIGLPTVQRIIQRHGGRVWAEGAVEQGATFYFTL